MLRNPSLIWQMQIYKSSNHRSLTCCLLRFFSDNQIVNNKVYDIFILADKREHTSCFLHIGFNSQEDVTKWHSRHYIDIGSAKWASTLLSISAFILPLCTHKVAEVFPPSNFPYSCIVNRASTISGQITGDQVCSRIEHFKRGESV